MEEPGPEAAGQSGRERQRKRAREQRKGADTAGAKKRQADGRERGGSGEQRHRRAKQREAEAAEKAAAAMSREPPTLRKMLKDPVRGRRPVHKKRCPRAPYLKPITWKKRK